MIQMFGEPISGTFRDRGPVMVIGLFGAERPEMLLLIDGDGMICDAPISEVNIDWRYDWRTGRWVDVGPYEDEDGDSEEEADGGSQEVPGVVPGADGAD